jgi:hypothetical protein
MDDPIFRHNFETLSINVSRIIRFVIDNGVGDPTRDSETASSISFGSCIDFGNAGQAGDPNLPEEWCPCPLVGMEIFDLLAAIEREAFIAMIGDIYDSIQKAMNSIYILLNIALLFNNPIRLNEYGHLLQDFFGGEHVRIEWVTIQVKCLT